MKDLDERTRFIFFRENDYEIRKVQSNFCISKKSLIDSSVISFGSNYCFSI